MRLTRDTLFRLSSICMQNTAVDQNWDSMMAVEGKADLEETKRFLQAFFAVLSWLQ